MKQLIPFLILATLVTGCHKRMPRTALPPPAPPPVEAVVPAPPPVVEPLPALDQADAAFSAANYAEAAREYEIYLQKQSSPDKDQALFRLALTYILSPAADWARGTSYLKQVVEQYPQSPVKPAAALLLGIQAELTSLKTDSQKRDQRIKQLTTELDRLKQIDAERRKKP